jgi:hypothetical protein
LNDVFEVELNLVGFQRVSESIERLLQLGFKTFDDGHDFFNSRLVNQTMRSIDQQTNVFVKVNVCSRFHSSVGLSHNAAARPRNFRREVCVLSLIVFGYHV